MKLIVQSKIEDNQVIIAKLMDVEETTTNREIITVIQELRHIIKYFEDELYEDFNKEL